MAANPTVMTALERGYPACSSLRAPTINPPDRNNNSSPSSIPSERFDEQLRRRRTVRTIGLGDAKHRRSRSRAEVRRCTPYVH